MAQSSSIIIDLTLRCVLPVCLISTILIPHPTHANDVQAYTNKTQENNNITVITQKTETKPEETKINIKSSNLKYATGKEAKFQCISTVNASNVYWINPDGIEITELNNTRFRAEFGWLNISNLAINDTGEYTCFTFDSRYNATVQLTVYIMPDYFLAGMIVLGINVVLILLFFTCLCYKTVQQKRATNKYKKYKNTMVPNNDNPMDGKAFKPHNKHLDLA